MRAKMGSRDKFGDSGRKKWGYRKKVP